MKHMDNVAQRVKNVIADVLKVELGRITDHARFVEDLGATSLQSVELVAAFEEEFDIEMDEEGALSVTDVLGAVTFIREYL